MKAAMIAAALLLCSCSSGFNDDERDEIADIAADTADDVVSENAKVQELESKIDDLESRIDELESR